MSGTATRPARPRTGDLERLADHFRSGHPGLIERSALASLVELAGAYPWDQAVDVLVNLLDWHLAAGPARLGLLLGMPPDDARRAVHRGRLALARAGLNPDGSPRPSPRP